MPTFKDLKEKARKFVRNKVLTKDELRRIKQKRRESDEEIYAPMKKAAEISAEDEDEEEFPDEMAEETDDPMKKAAEISAKDEDKDEEEEIPDEMDEETDDPMKKAAKIAAQDENEDDSDEALKGVRDLFETPEEKKERIFETSRQEREDELEELRGSGTVAEAKERHEARTLQEKIKLKEEEIARNKAAQTQISKEIIELSKEGIRLKKLQIKLKKDNQTEGLQETEEKIKILESEVKLKEEEISLNKKETEMLEGELSELKSESGETPGENDTETESDTESRSKKKHSVDEDEGEDEISDNYLSDEQREGLSKIENGLQSWAEALKKIKKSVENADEFLESRRFQQLKIKELQQIISLQDDAENLEWYIENLQAEIPEPIAKIIEQLNEETKEAVYKWDKDVWKPYTKDDLVKTLQQLGQRNSPLLKDSKSLSKLTDKRLKTLICYSKKGELEADREGSADLIRDESIQLMMKDREYKKDMWLSRGASPEGAESHPIYKELITLFPVGKEMKFFGEGEVNKDNLDEIEKVAKPLSTFKLFGSNPFKNFEDEIKETVRLNGGGIKTSRQMYIDTRKKINQTLSLAKKDPGVWKEKKNYELKKYYDAWLKASGKKFGDEINVQDIDPLLLNDKYNYLSKVESEVETLLNKIWETKFSGKETGKGKDKKFELQEKELDSKNQAIVRYFSEFLEMSNEAMKPLIEKKVESADKAEYQAMEEENKYKDNGEGENKGKRKAVRKSKSAPASPTSQAITTAWHDLRLKGRMYVGILVQFCNKRKKTIKESEKTRIVKLKEKIVKQFLEKLENQFDTKGHISADASQELKKFEALLEKFKEEILSTTHMSGDVFDEKIKLLEKQPSKKLKEEHYTLPEIE